MANSSTIYRFKIDTSDVDRSVYETLDLRVAMHPSETEAFLLTRIIAYCLNYANGLEFTAGLALPDEPAIKNGDGLSIEIGNPSPKRLHKISKASRQVRVYTYKDAQNILREAEGEKIHRAEEIQITSLDPKFLSALAGTLQRNNDWNLMHQDGELLVTVGEDSFSTSLQSYRFP